MKITSNGLFVDAFGCAFQETPPLVMSRITRSAPPPHDLLLSEVARRPGRQHHIDTAVVGRPWHTAIVGVKKCVTTEFFQLEPVLLPSRPEDSRPFRLC
jgi:hypothetical protein